MKNVLWSLMIILFLASCSGPSGESDSANEYVINGTADGASPGWIVLSKVADNKLVAVDSLETADGIFSFTGTIDMPEAYFLEFKVDQVFQRFFVEPGNINVSGNVKNLVFEGSEMQEIYDSYNLGVKRLDDQRDSLYADFQKAMESGDNARVEGIREEADRIDDMQKNFIMDFVKAQNTNVVGPYITVNNIYQFELDDLEAIRSGFSEGVTGSKYVKMIDDKIAKLKSVAIGQPAPLFSQNDSTGTAVALDSFKGKYLLVDFWASWCSPCRKENPNVVLAYQKYHDKGFDILGVSLDKDRQRWIDAIAADNLTWTHVSDLQGWQNEASNLYGVSSIPANFLLDPDGIIIGKDLREEALQEKLAEIFE